MPTTLPVAHWCLYYRRGDVRQDGIPALVQKTNDTGILLLAVWSPGGREPEIKRGVRHISDPDNKKRPYLAVENGLWDFREPVRIDTESGKKSTAPLSKGEEEDKIIELYERHGPGSSPKIAQEMTQLTGRRWNHQTIEKMLRELSKAAAK